jgi:hypothetical protein
MLQEALNVLLPLILWGAISGVLNLILTRKSQIETWVNANPRLAAWSKFLRGVGFDPWAVIAWFTLLVKKKLPEAQQSDSPIARLEQRKADAKRLGDEPVSIIPPIPPLGIFLLLGALTLLTTQSSCATLKPPCDEAKLAAIDASYIAKVSAACLPKYDRKEDCPEFEALRAEHRAELRQECGQ